MVGSHLISASSTTQMVVATSSGEAEFYALAKSASRALGAQSLASDLGVSLLPRVFVDSTASKGIASRRGVARVRHLHVQLLWVQQVVAERGLTVLKVQGTENPADMGTKHLALSEMARCMARCGLRFAEGQSEILLRAAAS